MTLSVAAGSITKPPLCAAAIRAVGRDLDEQCVKETATYTVVELRGGSIPQQKVTLTSLNPTQQLRAWAECLEENWAGMQHFSTEAVVGDRIDVALSLGACDR